MASRHALQRLARAQEAAGDVDREHARDARRAHFVDPHAEVDDAGVVDQHREAPEAPIHLAKHAHHLGLLRDIGGDRDAAGFARQRLGGVAIAHIVDGDLVAALGRKPRRRGADAPAAAGDEHDACHHRPRMKSLSRSAMES